MCEFHSHGHRGSRGHHGHAGCCCGPAAWDRGFPFRRRFSTREECIARLEEYLQNLQAEVQAVKERIAEIESAP